MPPSLRRSPPDRRHGRIKPPPWPRPPEALEVPSTCPTSSLEHRDGHAHHMTGFCRCHRAIPVHRRARAADRRGQHLGKPRPPPRPHHRVCHGLGKLFPTLIGCQRYRRITPVSPPPAGVRRGWKQRPPLAGRMRMHPVYMSQARGKKGGFGPLKTSQRSMDREHESTMSQRCGPNGGRSPVEAHGYDVAAP